MTNFYYMMRFEFVPANLFPWLPDYEEYDSNFDFSLFILNEPVDEVPGTWWLDRHIPGYSLLWRSLMRYQWMTLYYTRPDLVIFPWVPVARPHYWQFQYHRLLRTLRLE